MGKYELDVNLKFKNKPSLKSNVYGNRLLLSLVSKVDSAATSLKITFYQN
jgi:hypothetical protein